MPLKNRRYKQLANRFEEKFSEILLQTLNLYQSFDPSLYLNFHLPLFEQEKERNQLCVHFMRTDSKNL